MKARGLKTSSSRQKPNVKFALDSSAVVPPSAMSERDSQEKSRESTPDK